LALHRQQLVEGHPSPVRVVCQDHLAHGDNALGVKEHVLGAREADALGAEAARGLGVQGCLGVGAHAQHSILVGPVHQGGEVAG
jgi:hypothetical protein